MTDRDPIAALPLEGEVDLQGLGGGDLTRGLGRNVAWTYVHVAALAITNVVVTGAAVRTLGPAEFGYVAVMMTVAALFSIADFALSNSVVHSAARFAASGFSAARDEARADVHAAHATYVAVGAAILLLTVAFCVGLGVTWTAGDISTRQMTAATALFGCNTAVFLGTSAWIGIATGLRRFREIAVFGTIGAIVNTTVVIVTLESLELTAVPLGLVAGTVVTRVLLARSARQWARWFIGRPQRSSWEGSRRVYVFALPLLAMSAASQIVNLTDLVVVGAYASVAAVGLYKLGSTVPTMLIGMLYRGYDVSFPSLAGSDDRASQLDATAFLTRIVSFVSGILFTTIALQRGPIITVIAGDVDRMAASVLAIFAIVWLMNTPVHGLALLLIARGEHRPMAMLVGCEAVANVVLSIAMTISLGPLGAAWATLVTLAVSNLVVLPVIAARLGERGATRLVWSDGVGAAAIGAVVATIASVPALAVDTAAARLIVAGFVALGIGACVGAAVLGTQGRVRLRSLVRPA